MRTITPGVSTTVVALALILALSAAGARGAEGRGLSLAPAVHDFGAVEMPISSSARIFTIANTGEAEIEVSGISLSDSENFTLDVSGGKSPCGSPPFALGPGESCTVEVTFKPARERLYFATLSAISGDLPGQEAKAQLSGLGVMCGC